MNMIDCPAIATTFWRASHYSLRRIDAYGVTHASERAATIHADKSGQEVVRVDGGIAPVWLALNRTFVCRDGRIQPADCQD